MGVPEALSHVVHCSMRNKGKGKPLGNLDFMLELLRSQRFPREVKNDSVVERPNAESDDAALTLALQVVSKVNCGMLHNISLNLSDSHLRNEAAAVIAWKAVTQLA